MFNSTREHRISLSLSILGIINWFKDRKIKKDLNNIKSYDDFISENQDQDQKQEE